MKKSGKIIKCNICKVEVYVKKSYLGRKYCSRKCQGIGQRVSKIPIKCLFCEIIIYVSTWKDSQKYCSYICHHRNQKSNRVKIDCLTCKTIIYIPKSISNRKKYCSKKCFNISKIGKKPWNIGKVCSEETKRKIKLTSTGRKVSKETKQKISEAVLGEKHPMYGKHHSEETKQKLRLARIKQIEERYGTIFPNYNPTACQLFDWMNMYYDLNIQHAENGGEVKLDIGYFPDGYDTNTNTVYEYYEKWHKYQIDKDKKRKQRIIDHLDCEFIEIWE